MDCRYLHNSSTNAHHLHKSSSSVHDLQFGEHVDVEDVDAIGGILNGRSRPLPKCSPLVHVRPTQKLESLFALRFVDSSDFH